MPKKSSVVIGKLVRKVSRLKGGGSALPGLVVEKIDRDFLKDSLKNLKYGTVVVSGTNGKTTTTKIIVELLESQGLKVFTNRTGSNFVRGVIAAVLEKIDMKGRLDADIAVLELDEAHAVKFIEIIPPTYSLLLNVMRDQLDRFGEIDHTAEMLAKIAQKTTKTVVVNREDARLRNSVEEAKTKARVSYFGLSEKLASDFTNSDSLTNYKKPKALVALESITGDTAKFRIDSQLISTNLQLSGLYNTYNAAAALALVNTVLSDSDPTNLVKELENIKPAFGRGESFRIGKITLDLFLVKNPSGFQLALKSFDHRGKEILIAINDKFADGRDMSWLWDVEFSSLSNANSISISGTRAYDMALRLKYNEVKTKTVEENCSVALENLMKNSGCDKQIFCTYTAMLEIRKQLSKYTRVERVL